MSDELVLANERVRGDNGRVTSPCAAGRPGPRDTAVSEERHERIGELFGKALARPPEERATLLETECADEPELRAMVEALLAAHAHSSRSDRESFPRGRMSEPHVGSTLDGLYRIEEVLGRGGMGVVYKARHLLLKDTVAIKFLPSDVYDDPVRLQRFHREGQAARRFRHPSAVTVYDLRVSPEGPAYLVLEYVEGRTLRAEMNARGRLPAAETVALLEPIASVLDAAHRSGVVHRDLKPENVMVTRGDDGREAIKVLDLGIAKLRDAGDAIELSQQLTEGILLGTPLYMSPEQWGELPRDRSPEIDGRADVYSLAVMIYEIVSGIHPFKDTTRMAVWRRHCSFVPPPLDKVTQGTPAAFGRAIARALAKDRGDRQATAGALVAELRASVGVAPTMPSEASKASQTPSEGGGGITFVQARHEVRVTADGDTIPNNLPQSVTSFVGRERELEEIAERLADVRLLTLAGAGGVGKTRLALRVASIISVDFPGGVWCLSLAPLSDPALVPAALAAALQVRDRPGEAILDVLVEALGRTTTLLVLDNCEHLVEAAASLASTLLGACAGLTILATSREPLGIAGEAIWRVPPLALPSPDEPAASLAREAAVALFVDRARLVKPSFRLTDRNVATIAKLCRRLDGIPLAIELAASRARVLAPEQIHARLDDMFYLLTGGARDALPHHQTLRGTMDWSHSLLSEEQRVLFRRLAVFAGGFDLEAAERVARDPAGEPERTPAPGPRPPDHVFDVLAQLVDKSLVVAEEHGEDVRYALLEPMRQYAAEKLAASGDEWALRRAHRDWYLDLAERLTREIYGPRRSELGARLGVEHDNLRTALAWTLRVARDADEGLRFVIALGRFWHSTGRYREGLEWINEAVAAGTAGTPRLRAHAQSHRSHFAYSLADMESAVTTIEQGIALYEEIGDRVGAARERNHLVGVTLVSGDFERARAIQEANMVVARELELDDAVVRGVYNLGLICMVTGELGAAAEMLEEARVGFRRVGNEEMALAITANLGEVARLRGDLRLAAAHLEEGMALLAAKEDPRFPTMLYDTYARLFVDSGEHERARELFAKAAAIYRETGDRRGLVAVLDGCALAAAARGDAARAVCLDEAADGARRLVGIPQTPVYRDELRRRLEAVGGDPVELDAARARGRAMALDAALDYALAAEWNPHSSERVQGL
jgi:predicted ATPase/serine/threonine protein kinase